MALDQYHRYSNESERAKEDIYDDFKLKKTHLVAMFFTNEFSALRANHYCHAVYYSETAVNSTPKINIKQKIYD